MYSKATIASLVLYLLARGQAAAIGDRAPDGLQVIHVDQVGNDTLTWFGSANPVPRAVEDRGLSPLDVGCGTNDIKCSTDHIYYGPTCQTLFSTLDNNNWLSSSPRAVCLGQGDSQCCISWSRETSSSIQQKNLLPSAKRTLAGCGLYNRSGQEWNVNLGSTCLSQCLSNRPNGCK